MNKETPLTFESLTCSLKEAQNARSCLEKDLTEKRQTRNEMEKTLDSVSAKLTQTKDIHEKMQETMKIAQHKVAQTQSLSESLEETSESKRAALTQLSEQILADEEGREEDAQQVEEELSNISRLMREAKDLYSDDVLGESYDQSVKSVEELENKDEDYRREIGDMEKILQALLELEQESDEKEQLKNAEQIWTVFEMALKDAENYLRQLNNTLEEGPSSFEAHVIEVQK